MAKLNAEQIKKVAELIKKMPDSGHGLNFYSFGTGEKEIIAKDMYPSLNHPEAINFFFFNCLHQFGFWYGDDDGYVKPLIGKMNGKDSKGSDLLWKAFMKALNNDETVFRPERLANIEPEELLSKIFVDDNGPIPFPDAEKRFEITRAYGRWFAEFETSPAEIVKEANEKKESLNDFLSAVQAIDGYAEDPLEKKNLLLAMALANRPEKFLQIKDPENWSPVVDYHLMRLALRLGLVDLNEIEELDNRNRRWVDSVGEGVIRETVFDAVNELIKQSGRPMSFIDEKMWSARRYCPEMSEPNCEKCAFAEACEKRTELFQPVFRTTAY